MKIPSNNRKDKKGFNRKPEIRDDLDSRKNEEYKSKQEIKKAEAQHKDKQKMTRDNS